jgi:hypothetical protein
MDDDNEDRLETSRASGLDLIGGGSLGALLGLLIGLSATPVITGVIAGFVALFGGVFGVSDKLLGPSAAGMRRLTAFSLAAILVTPLSIWMRTHNTLGVSLDEHLRTLTTLGITDNAERLAWMKLVHFGIASENQKIVERPAVIGALYGFKEDSSLCRALRAQDAREGNTRDYATILSGHPETKKIQERIEVLQSPSDHLVVYRMASTYLCGV